MIFPLSLKTSAPVSCFSFIVLSLHWRRRSEALEPWLTHSCRRSLPHNLLGSLNKVPVPIYTPGWREPLWELSVLPKNTSHCPRPGFESRLLVPGTSTQTTRPPHLPVYIECAGYLYTNCDVKWQTCIFASWQTCISSAVIKGCNL